ncbi:DNA repair protein RecN [Aureivirga sp. CE67]|uniref:DNA repair protein RecN n=1 Tax=Aureivirga sp. CE67 TaxID=1788983 RepID=UPI0018C98B74|nr:DNA repair protein RecN [Aureivirga sp. CE67]
MLNSLFIKNYALIEQLNVDFREGFSIITGETGAGKSILLGALGLVLGKRADLSILKDKEKKCVIEAEFAIKNYDLRDFFEDNDLDFEENTIIRREILPSGKSRSYINDTPAKLNILNSLSEKLIDIHSQYQTLELSNTDFQFKIIDALSSNQDIVLEYRSNLRKYQSLTRKLAELETFDRESKLQFDYNLHLLQELQKAELIEDEQEEIEQKIDKLNNVESIKLHIAQTIETGSNEEIGIQSLLSECNSNLMKIADFSEEYKDIQERLESISIEFNDIIQDLEGFQDDVEFEPSELENLNDRLQIIYSLQKKHHVDSISDLLKIQEDLEQKVQAASNSSENISLLKEEIEAMENILDNLAGNLHEKRKNTLQELKDKLEAKLATLGMVNARFKINITLSDNYTENGKDILKLLFSANKGENYGELKKVASGGEMSRIMLSVKAILSNYTKLPTIIFDEIDTGVSGEVSNKMGEIMEHMSENMQVITISHLPQIAAKGRQHYKVYKEDVAEETYSRLKELTKKERIQEIAEMLGGKDLSASAVAHAKKLLK